jgi:phosphate acetyltransferase
MVGFGGGATTRVGAPTILAAGVPGGHLTPVKRGRAAGLKLPRMPDARDRPTDMLSTLALALRDGDPLTATVTMRARRDGDAALLLDCLCADRDGAPIVSGLLELRASAAQAAPVARGEGQRPPAGTAASPPDAGGADKFEPLLAAASLLAPLPMAVVHPCSEASLRAAVEAGERGLIVPILVAPAARLQALARAAGLALSGLRIVDVPHSHAAAETAVALVRAGEAAALMKGSLHTDELLGAVVDRASGLRTERRLSHVFLMDVPTYPKLLMVTDSAINIVPTLEEKRDICQNAIDLARAIGVARPKVAILCATETVNPRMPSTTDAASLCKMADRGQITGGVLDGPLAMDNAISAEAARVKGIRSEVAGDPDILLVPDLEAGNILAKQLTFMAGAQAAGLVVGARVPIVLTSRADGVRARLASCAVAALMAQARRTAAAKALG